MDDNNNANSNENVNENANANSQDTNQGTQENGNSTNANANNTESAIDYKTKFSESAKEAQRLYEENKLLREQFELKGTDSGQHVQDQNVDSLYPGFEDLDEDARNNLIAYTKTVTSRAKEELYKDPAIAFARKQYAERTWDTAFEKTLQKFPELAETREEFKNKYYNVNNVPENIESILQDVAKIHLFDKAKDIGAKETEEKKNRIEGERTSAGFKESTAKRSLDDWNRMATENPSQFAKLSREYQADLDSGKI